MLIDVMVGPSFTELTVNVKVVEAVATPSLTVIVISVAPFWLAAGVIVTVRSDPLPPNTMFPLGTRVVTLELPLRLRLIAGVSASPILKGIAVVAVFSAVV